MHLRINAQWCTKLKQLKLFDIDSVILAYCLILFLYISNSFDNDSTEFHETYAHAQYTWYHAFIIYYVHMLYMLQYTHIYKVSHFKQSSQYLKKTETNTEYSISDILDKLCMIWRKTNYDKINLNWFFNIIWRSLPFFKMELYNLF